MVAILALVSVGLLVLAGYADTFSLALATVITWLAGFSALASLYLSYIKRRYNSL
jgi:hypothetical protein